MQAVCEREGSRLWGISLCGPMVIADSRTQTIATSQPAPEGPRPRGSARHERADPVGRRDVGGVQWDTLANAPPLHAREMLMHELFHGIVQASSGWLPRSG